ncbi:MAG: hypothetical protein AAF734_03585, partial [Bacteroidota bacterium]
MRKHTTHYLLLLLSIVLISHKPLQAQILKIGQAVVTCDSDDPTGHVVGIIDIRDRTGVAKGLNWEAPMYKHPSWTKNQLGSIFGICIHNNGDIYITATNHYGSLEDYGPGGAGGIYKIDGATGNWNLFTSLILPPGVSIGNIAYDERNNQLFVTTRTFLGMIYRIDANSGDVLSSMEVPIINLLWGVAVQANKLFYSVGNTIYSVDLIEGDFDRNSVVEEATVESFNTNISDIEVGT